PTAGPVPMDNPAPNVNPQPIPGTVPPQPASAPNAEPTVVNPSGEVVNPTSNPVASPDVQGQMNGNLGQQPVAGTLASNNTGSPVGMDPLMNANVNGFVEPNKAENIGMAPPSNDPNTKKPMNKIVFVILIIVLMLGVAFGVYYYLSVSKTKISVSTRDLTISTGDVLSSNPSDYATITGTNSSNCAVNTLNVDTATVGSYEYILTCNGTEYKGKVNVQDGVPPVLKTKIVYKKINGTVVADDFVESCTDSSKCTYDFESASKVNEFMSTTGGPNEVNIKAQDGSGNTTVGKGILYVLPSDLRLFGVCSTPDESESNFVRKTTDRFAIGDSFLYLGAARREYSYSFANVEAYQAAVGEKLPTMTYNGVTGLATYDDVGYTLTISTDLDTATLNNEFNGTFPTNYLEILTTYRVRNYTCVQEMIQ
ncbi:MAG: hypothetical protein K2M17_03955, partial [Bacilli bacterium]|nr:hypothetical protein [Bacilli bacterium]